MFNNSKKIITAYVVAALSWMTLSVIPTGAAEDITKPKENALSEDDYHERDVVISLDSSEQNNDNVPEIIDDREGGDESFRQENTNNNNVQDLEQTSLSSSMESSGDGLDEIENHLNDGHDENGKDDEDEDIDTVYNPVGLQHWSDGEF